MEEELIGVFCGHPKGFGFVTVEELDKDIFIGEDNTGGAMDKDTVAVRLIREPQGEKRAEGKVTRVVRRENDTIVGTYEKSRHFGFVVPDNIRLNKDIFVSKENSMGAMNGHKVVVRVTDFGNDRKNPEEQPARGALFWPSQLPRNCGCKQCVLWFDLRTAGSGFHHSD